MANVKTLCGVHESPLFIQQSMTPKSQENVIQWSRTFPNPKVAYLILNAGIGFK